MLAHASASQNLTRSVLKLFRKILEDLSAADPTLPKTSDVMTSAAVLQAQQLQAALQQVASSGGLTNTSLLPGLLQGAGDQISSPLSVMLPAQQQVNHEPSQICEHNNYLCTESFADTTPISSITVNEFIWCSTITGISK